MPGLPQLVTDPSDAAPDGAPDNVRDLPTAVMLARRAEEQRQRALDSLVLEEGVARERFDRITRMACRILDVPQAYITVLDRDRAWWPSIVGFDGVTEAPREQTLCHTTQALGAPVVVPDARSDPRFAGLGLVRDGLIVSYAGFPLRDPSGHVLGSLCVSDTRVRVLDQDDLAALADLAAWAEQELLASREMHRARQVQSSMLPGATVTPEEWQVAGLCLPALAVGGDFYDYTSASSVLHVMLGDVMGKGTGAALVGAGVRAALRGTTEAVVAGVDLGVTTTRVARAVQRDLDRAGAFVTLHQVAVDLEDGTVRYVDAGAGLGLLVGADGTCTRLDGQDRPLGVLEADTWTEHVVRMGPGDRLLLVSDGVLDLIDDPLTWWEPLCALVRAAPDADHLLADVADLARRTTPLDDVTAVAVLRNPEDRP